MKTLYIGDSHSRWNSLFLLIDLAKKYMPDIERVVSVGDFGFWPRINNQYLEEKTEIFFIDGNHEDHLFLNQKEEKPYIPHENYNKCFHIPRGYFEGGISYLGGAFSIDKDDRILNETYFTEEEVTEEDVKQTIQNAKNNTVNVLVTHDTSSSGFFNMKKSFHLNEELEKKSEETRMKIQLVLEALSPKLHIHGHWHQYQRYNFKKTKCISLKNVDFISERANSLSENDKEFFLKRSLVECTVVANNEGKIFPYYFM